MSTASGTYETTERSNICVREVSEMMAGNVYTELFLGQELIYSQMTEVRVQVLRWKLMNQVGQWFDGQEGTGVTGVADERAQPRLTDLSCVPAPPLVPCQLG